MSDEMTAAALPVVSALELQRVSQELGETKAKLADERRRREENLDKRLEELDRGQLEILRKMEGMGERKVDTRRFDELEIVVRGQGRLVWIGFGIVATLSFAIPLALKAIWH